ncbi:low temperature requirement protein A [Amycolatopsis taiwanensis]|uniref:low temperature requirement protein A n=1 Tax=Amycolatopsis taiwanensis TaxID=342230 RepID=UPI002553DA35|nr:low temperature requirement protein A [Amycolatopsis taiwanensis]
MSDGVAGGGVLRRIMRGRDPSEAHRVSTPLELLFDLCFVVAVAQAAGQWHHALADGRVLAGLVGYASVFFAIWWAWMNFTWFASAYDTDDVPYRLLTLVQMGGVLVLAAGVPAAFSHGDFTIVVVGYVIMRLALVSQWLRAAIEHVEGRPTALRYAAGITVVQFGWIARLWAPGVWAYVTFLVLVAAELAVPLWAEYRGHPTSWHPGHITDRYGAFTIIVLGEVVLATFTGVQDALSEPGETPSVLITAAGGLLLVFAVWWIYLTGAEARLVGLRTALLWGYGHYVVFAAVAALGAGLGAAIDTLGHHSRLDIRVAALAVAVPLVVSLVVFAGLHRVAGTGAVGHPLLVVAGVVIVLGIAVGAPGLGLGLAVLTMGLAVAATLAANLAVARHRRRSPDTQ